MRDLLLNQHELIPDDSSDGLLFGTESTSYVTLTHPAITSDEPGTADAPMQREDGTDFGEDWQGGKTAAFDIGVLTDRTAAPHVNGGRALEVFESAWRARKWRTNPHAYAVLRSHMVPGQVRRAYGRPRRYAETTDSLTKKGYSTLLADFTARDGKWYDDVETTVQVGLTAGREDGFYAPIITPLVTVPATTGRPGRVSIGGTEETWIRVTIRGPIVAPVVKVGPLTVAFTSLSLAAGQWVEVTGHPWRRQAVRHDGASVRGLLTYQTAPLKDMFLEPGDYPVTLSGSDPTGNSYVEVGWRNAYTRW